MSMRQPWPGVYEAPDRRLFTRNLAPGFRVGEEELLSLDGVEYRSWNPQRSKLAAMLLKGVRTMPIAPGSHVLYLGAAAGATASYVGDIVGAQGLVYAVEHTPRPFRDLVQVAEHRPNLLPILADAARPERYQRLVGPVEVAYQDISQRAQGQLFLRNVATYRPRVGILMVKARSVDVASDPRVVYDNIVREVTTAGHKLLERVDLAPFERDHAALVFELAPKGP